MRKGLFRESKSSFSRVKWVMLILVVLLLGTMLATYGVDIKPLPPIVNSGAAINITHNSAILNGNVNPNGLPTSVKFQYGTSTSYGSNTNVESVGSGTSITKVTPVPLSSLTPFTTYHYRLTGTNRDGTTDGVDMIFNTPIAPPATLQVNIEKGYSPDIVVSSDGTKVYIVYQGEIGAGEGIIFKKSTDNGQTFGAKVNVSPGNNGDSGDKPSIAIDSAGNIHVVYMRSSNYNIYYTKSTDGGGSFIPPEKINDEVQANSLGRPRIAASGTDIYVVWDGDDDRIYMDKSPIDSLKFGADLMGSPSTGYHYRPSITTDNSGNIYVLWHGRDKGMDNQIHLAKSTNKGVSFLPSVRVDDSSSDVRNPSVAVSGHNVYVTWEGMGMSDIRCRLSKDGGATFSSPSVKVNDDKTSEGQLAEVKVDAKGTIYVVWQDKRGSADAPNIYYSYASTDNTKLVFSANMKVNTEAGTSEKGHIRPALAIGNVNIFILWQAHTTSDPRGKVCLSK